MTWEEDADYSKYRDKANNVRVRSCMSEEGVTGDEIRHRRCSLSIAVAHWEAIPV